MTGSENFMAYEIIPTNNGVGWRHPQYMDVSKNRGGPQKMDGWCIMENPYEQMDDLGGKNPYFWKYPYWLVVSTHLKNISQNWKPSPNRGENKKYLSCHHLVMVDGSKIRFAPTFGS